MDHSLVGYQDAGGTGACPRPRGGFRREVLYSSSKVRGLGVLGSLRCERGCDPARPTWTAIACPALVGKLLFPRASHASASCCGCFDLASHMGGVVGRNVSDVEEW